MCTCLYIEPTRYICTIISTFMYSYMAENAYIHTHVSMHMTILIYIYAVCYLFAAYALSIYQLVYIAQPE